MDTNSSSGQPAQSTAAPEVAVRANGVEHRFELYVDGAPAGFVAYQLQDNTYALTHTEIDPEFEGRGLGSTLISGALDQIQAAGHLVVPVCPFVLSFLRRHKEYLVLVPARYRDQYELPAG